MVTHPQQIDNRIGERAVAASGGAVVEKLSPATGEVLSRFARSGQADVSAAVSAAAEAQPAWEALGPVRRGEILRAVSATLERRRDEMAECVARETGKSRKDALGETGAAVELGYFMAGEGRRYYGKITAASTPGRRVHIIRKPIGVVGLIIASNTPVANVAWKVFPALMCGNGAVLKPSEDTPETADLFARIAADAGLPPGVLNLVQGLGEEAGAPLVADARVGVVSFTGSAATGRRVAAVAAPRLAKLSLELGGKNPMVICDDADLEVAVRWAVLSAFSNAGQRCAAASRLLVFEGIYDAFKERFLAAVRGLRLGPADDCDLGPVINRRQRDRILAAVKASAEAGTIVLAGGRAPGGDLAAGCYVEPTVLEAVPESCPAWHDELFGPVVAMRKVSGLAEAISISNDSPYGLTAAIHTRAIAFAMEYAERCEAGVVNINAGTFGSEPHMPFGGFKSSGNGTREPGEEALEVYSNLRNIGLGF